MPKYVVLVYETILHEYEFETEETEESKIYDEFYDLDPDECDAMLVESESRTWEIFRVDPVKKDNDDA